MKTLSARVGIAVVFLFFLAATVLAIRSGTRSRKETRQPSSTAVADRNAGAVLSPGLTVAPAPAITTPVTSSAPVAAQNTPPTAPAVAPLMVLPPNATAVPDDALLQLASLVNLPDATTQPPDKARWEQAVPAASKLMDGPCDCDQRNWLKHFVAMGNDALAGSSTDYVQDAQLMSTLRRYDTQSKPVAGR